MDRKELEDKVKSLNEAEIWQVLEETVDRLVHSNADLMAYAYKNIANETLSQGYVSGSALKLVAQRIREMHKKPTKIVYIICDNGLIYQTDIDINTGCRYVRHIYDMAFNDVGTMEIGKNEEEIQNHTYSSEEYVQKLCKANDFQRDIKSLKKMIKHCKNPMKKKSLEKELNEAYRKRKIK